MPRLTEMVARNAKPPKSGQYVIFDDLVKGFGLRLSQGGTRSWVLVISRGTKKKKVTIGRYPDMSLSEAREAARELLARDQLAKSVSVQVQAPEYSDAVAHFLETYCRRQQSPGWAKEVERHLTNHFAGLAGRTLDEIQARDIAAIIDTMMDRPGEANHAFSAIRRFFNWAVERGHITVSPCNQLKLPARQGTRDRVLSDDEIRIIWNAATEYPFGAIVRLLLLVGQRRGETTALKWEYIDFDRSTIFLPRAITKNNRDHTIPFGEMAAAHLQSIPRTCEYLFPARGYTDRSYCGWSKGKVALNKLCQVPQWGLHDIRRTVATNLAGLNTPPHVVEKLLNHASGTISGVAAIYNRFQYLDEMRDALTEWEAKLASIVSGEPLAPVMMDGVEYQHDKSA